MIQAFPSYRYCTCKSFATMPKPPKDRDSPLFGSESSSSDDEQAVATSPPSKDVPEDDEGEGSPEDSTPNGRYVVEKILASAPDSSDPDQDLYLVKWEGYNFYASTWEPLENLEHAQAALAEFLENEGDFDIDAFERQKQEWVKHQEQKAMLAIKRAKAQNTVFRVQKGMTSLGKR